jgi:2-(1,2-epoxy-1,2-dihydrophenyl)acetyl-CoA isomerase
MSDTLYEIRDSIAVITLNRPEKLNSVTMPQLEDLIIQLYRYEQDDNVRAVIITATGRGFCTGADLSGGGGRHDVATPVGMKLSAHLYGRICFTIASIEKPVIAAVNGIAAGSGCNLALCCDMVLAAKSAKFIQIFVKRGMVPDCGGTYFLPRLVGLAKAKELIMTGEPVLADDALALGMVNRVVEDGRLMEEATALAAKLAKGPTRSIGMIKHLVNRSYESDLMSQLDMEAAFQGLATATEDMREGWTSFFEKREPKFQGK